jgi:hypothetical protein
MGRTVPDDLLCNDSLRIICPSFGMLIGDGSRSLIKLVAPTQNLKYDLAEFTTAPSIRTRSLPWAKVWFQSREKLHIIRPGIKGYIRLSAQGRLAH